MGPARAEALTAFFKTILGFYFIFWVVMLAWPIILKRTIQDNTGDR